MANDYKIVILGEDWELYRIAYKDINIGNTKYKSGFFPSNKFLRILFKIHFYKKINHIIRLPFKIYWNNYLFKDLDKDVPTLFIVLRSWFSVENNLKWINYIRSNFRNSKIVIFLQDIVSTYQDYFAPTPIDIVDYKSKVDLILSFDRGDADKYGLTYHKTVLSQIDIQDSQKPNSDVFFIGKDKGRLRLIRNLYTTLSKKGLKCLFMVSEVPIENRIPGDGIIYLDRQLPYTEILEYVKNTRCLLEILQSGAVGITYRTLESIVCNKKLITNNLSLKKEDIYSDRFISFFNNVEDIDIGFISNSEDAFPNGNPFRQQVNPRMLIGDIEQCLNIRVDIK